MTLRTWIGTLFVSLALASATAANPGETATAGVRRPSREGRAIPAVWGRAREPRTVLAALPRVDADRTARPCPPVWEWAASALRLPAPR